MVYTLTSILCIIFAILLLFYNLLLVFLTYPNLYYTCLTSLVISSAKIQSQSLITQQSQFNSVQAEGKHSRLLKITIIDNNKTKIMSVNRDALKKRDFHCRYGGHGLLWGLRGEL